MTVTCKYEERNRTEKKCSDDYYSSTHGCMMCRVVEWKEKKGVCPYDHSIRSRRGVPQGQKTLEGI